MKANPEYFTRQSLALFRQAEPNAPLVDVLFSMVAEAVKSQRVAPGTRLPSVRQLASDCGVSRDTVARAYDKLVAHGKLQARRGSGFYVKGSATHVPRSSGAGLSGASLDELTQWRLRLLVDDPKLLTRTGSGTLPESWLDGQALNDAIRSVGRSGYRKAVHYNDPQGYLPLRQQLQMRLQDIGIRADREGILCTSGATEAIHLIAHIYLPAGQKVLIEEPGPLLLRDRLASTGVESLGVPRLPGGPDLVQLRKLCQEHRPSFFFCSSVLHSPTGASMAAHTAFELLRLAEEFDLTLVEDDAYGDLAGSGGGIARLATLDQLKRVIYVGSFTKTLGAGLRCGFVAASAERIAWMSVYRALDCISTNSFAERVVYRVLSEGGYRHHCEQLRHRLDQARPQVIDRLTAMGMKVNFVPEAGMYVWAKFPEDIDATSLAKTLYAGGHLLAPGRAFSSNESHRSFVRFNITECSAVALDALAAALR